MAITRIVALGASNLTRGLHAVVSTARGAWGPDVEVLGALGHGRSYGAPSRFVVRTVPGILESGLWQTLSSLPPAPTRALVTDVGNDILYGFGPDQTLAWVEACVDRVRDHTSDIVMTGLPVDAVRRLSAPKFMAVRSALVPSCRLSLAQVVDQAERVNAGLEALARRSGARYMPLDPRWYSVDPIHFRPSQWWPAWQAIVGETCGAVSRSNTEGWQIYLMRPERQWLCGVEQQTPQPGVRLERGGRLWLF